MRDTLINYAAQSGSENPVAAIVGTVLAALVVGVAVAVKKIKK